MSLNRWTSGAADETDRDAQQRSARSGCALRAASFLWHPQGDRPASVFVTMEPNEPLTGALTIGVGEALVTDALVLGTFSLRLANADGAWTGTGRAFGGDETQGVDIWELTGEGGYDGLRLFMFDHEGIDQPWGVIVAGEAIPPFPELPLE